jgi:hypothetical protein
LQPVERVGVALDLQAVGGVASGQVDKALPVGDDADGGVLGGTAGEDIDRAVVHPDGHAPPSAACGALAGPALAWLKVKAVEAVAEPFQEQSREGRLV